MADKTNEEGKREIRPDTESHLPSAVQEGSGLLALNLPVHKCSSCMFLAAREVYEGVKTQAKNPNISKRLIAKLFSMVSVAWNISFFPTAPKRPRGHWTAGCLSRGHSSPPALLDASPGQTGFGFARAGCSSTAFHTMRLSMVFWGKLK